MNKYISVKDFSDYCDRKQRITHSELLERAVEMVKVSAIQNIINKFMLNNITFIEFFDNINLLINPQPEKFGGFTIPEWEQLNKLPYVLISLDPSNGEFSRAKVFLNGNINRHNIKELNFKLLSDPDNMERTNTNIPDGIEIECVYADESACMRVTPNFDNAWTHYRIIGKANK